MTTTYRGQRSTYSLRQDKDIANSRVADIYLAKDDVSKRVVALKCFRAYYHLADSLVGYYREVHTLSQMHHPNILEILDYSGDPQRGETLLALPSWRAAICATCCADAASARRRPCSPC